MMSSNRSLLKRLYRQRTPPGDPTNGPVWSPDGKYIAFDLEVSAHPPGIYLMDADGRHVHRMTQVPLLIAWQPIP